MQGSAGFTRVYTVPIDRNPGTVSGARLMLLLLLIATAYCVTGRLGMLLAVPPGYATAIWPPAGIALAAMMIYGRRIWPGIFLGSFSVNLWMSLDSLAAADATAMLTAASVAIGAVLQSLFSLWLLNRFTGLPLKLNTLRGVAALFLLGGAAGCLCNGVLGPSVLLALDIISPSQFWFNAWNWWVGDTIGVLVVTPLILIWSNYAGEFWRDYRAGITTAVVVAFVGVMLMFRFADDRETARIDGQFNKTADIISAAIGNELNAAVNALVSLQSLFDSSNFVGAEEFRQFTSRTLDNHPSISALSWNPHVRHAERLAFEEERLSTSGKKNTIYEVAGDGKRMNARDRDAYVVVEYIEPQQNNSAALGYDALSDPERRKSIEASRDRAAPVATRSLKLVQGSGPRQGMLIFAPVFADANIPETLAERRRNIEGYVVGVVSIDSLVIKALEVSNTGALTLELLERSESGDPVPLLTINSMSSHTPAVLSTERAVSFAGREWALQISADTEYVAGHRAPGVWLVLAAGLVLCATLSGFLLILAGNAYRESERAVQLARANSRMEEEFDSRRKIQNELHREKEQAEVTLNCIADGVISTDMSNRIVYMNPVAENLTGWTLAEAAGHELAAVFSLRDSDGATVSVGNPESPSHNEATDSHGDELRLIHRSGSEYEIRYDNRPLRDSNGEVSGSVLVFQDETDARRMARDVAHRAAHDALTGLVNRDEFEKRLDRAIQNVKSYGGVHSLCFIDLDQFKVVNDTAGHSAGDELLQQIAHLIFNRIRSRDTLARLGGDEFGLLLEHCAPDKAHELATAIISDIRDFRFVWDDQIFGIGASVGLVAVDAGTHNTANAMQQADMACYTAKDLGRSRVHVFCSDETLTRQRVSELRSAADLRSAIDEDRLALFVQKIQPLSERAGQTMHHEVLLRLRSADGQLVAPGMFIQAAERYDMMSDVDRWVVANALEHFHEISAPNANLCINLSGNSLGKEQFSDYVLDQLQSRNIPGERVCFEITETAAIRNLDAAMNFFKRLRAVGCRFALDDFGSGISSFSYLKSLPVDYLKIDGSLVRSITTETSARAMVAAIHHVAQTMNLQTIAEHVSDDEILAVVKEIGIDYAQGYAIHKPEAALSSNREAANADEHSVTKPLVA